MKHELKLAAGPVRLVPLTPTHSTELFRHLSADLWRWMSGAQPATEDQLRHYVQQFIEAENQWHFAVLYGEEVVGRTALYDLIPGARAMIGYTIYAAEYHGGVVNPAAKLALLTHCFQHWELPAVGLRCDEGNLRSRRAIEKLGAEYEGTLRCGRLNTAGEAVNMCYYSILRQDWPAVQRRLQQRINAAS